MRHAIGLLTPRTFNALDMPFDAIGDAFSTLGVIALKITPSQLRLSHRRNVPEAAD
jgi:hypothetical protein